MSANTLFNPNESGTYNGWLRLIGLGFGIGLAVFVSYTAVTSTMVVHSSDLNHASTQQGRQPC